MPFGVFGSSDKPGHFLVEPGAGSGRIGVVEGCFLSFIPSFLKIHFGFLKALQACLREKRATRARTERTVEDASLPSSLHTIPTIAAIAEEWIRESQVSEESSPVNVVLLLEEYSPSERNVLRSLFHSLAETQKQDWFRSKVAFSVVLWASSETEMEADLFDHLFWTKYPFLPSSTMLKNVLYAALVEPTLPFMLPAQVYSWILQHFSNESHSLAWLLHVLHAVICSFYSSTPGSWALLHTAHAVAPAGLNEELRRLIPMLPSDSVQDCWRERLNEWHRFRETRVDAFSALWRLLLQWNPAKTRSLLDEYGEYLTKSSVGQFDQFVRATVVSEVVQYGPVEMQRRFEATLAELRDLAKRPNPPLFIVKALAELESAVAPPPPPPPPPSATEEPVSLQKSASAVAVVEEYVLKKPKDLLLEPSRGNNNPNLRRSMSSGSGWARRETLSSTLSSYGDDRKVAAILKCVEWFLPELAAPSAARFPLLACGVFAVDTDMAALLWGNHRLQVLAQLERPSWKCMCCRVSGGLSDRKKMRKSVEPEYFETHEDVCLAFSFASRGGKVDFGEWEAHFCAKIGMEKSNKVGWRKKKKT
jgi:hypothetical protein